MLSAGLLSAAYLVAGILFILSLGGLAKQETARQGNLFGIKFYSLFVFSENMYSN